MEGKNPDQRATSLPSTVKTNDSYSTPSQNLSTTATKEGLLNAADTGHEDPLSSDSHNENHVHYKTLNWWHCGVLMIAECISLGILSLPHSLAVLGLVPGLLLILGLGVIAGYTGYVIGQFKIAHPTCTSMADAGMIMFGPIGRELFGWGQLIVLVFIMAAHITSFAIMMNVLTSHCTCTIVFSVLGLVISIVATLPRTLKNISYLSVASCLSIFTAVFIVMVGVGITKPNPNQMVAVGQTNLIGGMNAVLNIVLAYSGHVTYFGFASELKRPKDFTKSLIMLQTTAILVYATCAIVIYYYVGPGVPAPALSAAGHKVRLAAYGVASLTIIIAGVVNGSVGSKQIYLRFWEMRKLSKVVQEKTTRAYVSWVVIVSALWFLAWIIAEAIPKFEYVLALVAALFSGWYSFGITSVLWFNMNKQGRWHLNGKKIALSILNAAILIIGCIISIVGLYACGKAIHDGASGKPFSCNDNSI